MRLYTHTHTHTSSFIGKGKVKTEKIRNNNHNGITLVALVVTIVVLLILAGITITYVMGDNSIFKKASEAKLQTDIAKSREKLEVTFGHAKLLKHTDKEYNQDDYLDELMTKEIPNIEIKGDIVIVDGYVFEIDRSEPKIGQYVGKQSELVFPEITVNVTLAEDAKTATIHITAKEDKNGISKIEIIQGGYVLETYECENTKEEVVKEYTAKQNGTYTIKVYAGLTVSEKAKVEGLIANVEYSPNGNEEYKKEHQVKVSVKETKEKVKSIKYQWLETTVEPEADTFTETCSNNATITGKDYTGTYYLWTLLETESGKTNIGRSEGFNFDNEGPIVTAENIPETETSFTIEVAANDNETTISKYEIYVNGKKVEEVNTEETEKSFTINVNEMGIYECYAIVTDKLGNEARKDVEARTLMYTWTKYGANEIYQWTMVKGSLQTSWSARSGDPYISGTFYTSYSLDSSTGKVTYSGSTSKVNTSSTKKFYSSGYILESNYKSGDTSWKIYKYFFSPTKELVSSMIDLNKKYGYVYSTNIEEYEEDVNINSYYYVYEGLK